MKAKELMIGDWVYDSLTFDTLQVDGACIKHAEYREQTEQGECFMPIPLTGKMLRANSMPVEDFCGYMCIVIEREGVEDENAHGHSSCKKVILDSTVIYVHELQHAFRLVGNDELADNFKIE